MGSLVLGIVSVAALAGQVLWGLPLVGAITAVVALARIDRSAGTLVGRRLALWGLGLSIFFGAIAAAHFLTNERLLADRAAEVGQKWFTALAHGEPQVARQLNVPFKSRARTSDPAELWVHYREAAGDRKDLEQFVADPLILRPAGAERSGGRPAIRHSDCRHHRRAGDRRPNVCRDLWRRGSAADVLRQSAVGTQSATRAGLRGLARGQVDRRHRTAMNEAGRRDARCALSFRGSPSDGAQIKSARAGPVGRR